MLLAALGILYLIGFICVYLWSEDIDVKGKLRAVLGITQSPDATIINDPPPESAHAPSQGIPSKQRPVPRLLLEEPVADDLPIVDEFTESIKAGRPVPQQGENATVVSLPSTAPTKGISLDPPLTPLGCWDSRGFEHEADKCDSLFALNQVLKSKLDLFLTCRDRLDASTASGKMTFYLEADFIRDAMSFWVDSGAGLKNKADIVTCVAEALKGLSIQKLPHRHARYRMKGQVRFEGARGQAANIPTGSAPANQIAMEKLEKALATAKEVAVVKERVRVRKSPVDGEIIGFISQPAKVQLLEKSDEWCLVKTKRGNVGWMVCWGLSAETSPPSPAADAGSPHPSP
jgi:hypothetical protein